MFYSRPPQTPAPSQVIIPLSSQPLGYLTHATITTYWKIHFLTLDTYSHVSERQKSLHCSRTRWRRNSPRSNCCVVKRSMLHYYFYHSIITFPWSSNCYLLLHFPIRTRVWQNSSEIMYRKGSACLTWGGGRMNENGMLFCVAKVNPLCIFLGHQTPKWKSNCV